MTNNEIATQSSNQPARYEDPTGGRLMAWASSLQAAHQIASALCSTSFVPAHFRGKPEEAAAAILNGDELGLSPMQAMQSLFIIGGKPSLYARTMVAIVQARGHEVWTVAKSDESVTVHGRRRGSEHVIVETWTTERAQKAGYTNNKKYSTDPQAMLYARAASDVCRQIAPDALAGVAFSSEELEVTPQGDAPVVEAVVEPDTQERVRMSRARGVRAIEAQPEPEIVEEDAQVEEETTVVETGEVITPAQLKGLQAGFSGAGVKDRDVRLAYCTQLIGREVGSANELTKREASIVIDALNKDKEVQA